MKGLYKRSGALALLFLVFMLQTYAIGSLGSKSQLLQTNPCEGGSSINMITDTNFSLSKNDIIVPPSNLKLEKAGFNTIKFSWTDNSDNETCFVIERKTDSEQDFTEIASICDGSNVFEDFGLKEATIYNYRIKAINTNSYSEYISFLFSTQSVFTFSDFTIENASGLSAWADYDNDDDLDLAVCKQIANGEYITQLYENIGNGNFEIQSFQLRGANRLTHTSYFNQFAKLEWIDYNKDGFMDLYIAGVYDELYTSCDYLYRNNAGSSFSEIAMHNKFYNSSDWGDYDNDGDIDLITLSNNLNQVMVKNVNTPSGFIPTRINCSLDYFIGTVKWIDFNNDGFLDLFLGGKYFGENTSVIYKNNGKGHFFDSYTFNENFNIQSIEIADYNGDKFPDILLLNNYKRLELLVFTNNGGQSFTKKLITDVNEIADVTWFDINGDKKLDILAPVNDSYKFFINTNDNFVESSEYNTFDWKIGTLSICDYDNDKDLDISITDKNHRFTIVRNNQNKLTQVPATIENLQHTTNNKKVTLSWPNSTEAYSYNLLLYSATDTIVMPANNLATGYVKQVKSGNMGYANNFVIDKLANGTYFWKIQAISNNYVAGAWSEENVFILNSCIGVNINKPEVYDEEICQNHPWGIGANGQNIRWYNSDFQFVVEAGGFYPPKTNSGSFVFYVTQTIDNCEGSFAKANVIIKEIPTATFEIIDASSCSASDGKIVFKDKSKTTKIRQYFSDYHTSVPGQNEFINVHAGVNYFGMISTSDCYNSIAIKVETKEVVEAPKVNTMTVCNGGILNSVKLNTSNTHWYDHTKNHVGEDFFFIYDNPPGLYNYWVTYFKGFCESDMSPIELTILPAPNFSVSSTSASDCHTYNGTITLSQPTDSSLIYSITEGKYYQSLPFYTNLGSGGYSVFAKSENGCITTNGVYVQSEEYAPAILVDMPTVCKNDTNVSFTATGENITWWKWGGEQLASGNTFKAISNTPNGFFDFEVRSTFGHCEVSTGYLSYQIHDLPVSTFSENRIVCEGGKTILNAYSGYNYTWEYSESLKRLQNLDFEFTPKATTTYSFLMENIAGCKAIADITISVHPLPGKGIITGLSELCLATKNVKYSSNVVPDITYDWVVQYGDIIKTSKANEILVNWYNYGNPGLKLTHTSTKTGCFSETVYNIISKGRAPDKVATMLKGTNLFYIEDTKPFTYQWFKNNQEVPGETKQFYNVGNIDIRASYFCRTGNNNGCFTDSYPYGNVTGIENLADNQVRLYPNPSAGNFVIEFEEVQTLGSRLEIANISGKMLYTEHLPAGTNRFEVNLNNRLVPGIYFLRLKNNLQIIGFAKIIIE